MLDLDLLPTFAVFADTLSLTEAGRRCGLTQPAVHGQIRRLAEALDDPLYTRQGRQLALTQRGIELSAFAREVVTRRDAFLSGSARPLRLAAGRGAWTWWLPEQLGPFMRSHHIQPVLADGSTALAGVREGRLDYGVATGPADREGLSSFRLRDVTTVLLMAPDDPLRGREEVGWSALDGRAWVLPSPGRPHRVVLEAAFAQAGLAWTVGAIADDWMVAGRFAAMGAGIAAVNDPVEVPGCARVALRDGPVTAYHLFWRTGARVPLP